MNPRRARYQCLNARCPVNTIVTPASLQASITSQSLIEPPGWTTDFMPWRIPTSTPSLKGKKASETIAAPIRSALGFACEGIDLLYYAPWALFLFYGKLQVLIRDFSLSKHSVSAYFW